MFNVTDGQGRSFCVDFVLLFCSDLTLSITDVILLNRLPNQTPGIRDEKISVIRTDISAKSAIFYNNPRKKKLFGPRIFEEPNFCNLG